MSGDRPVPLARVDATRTQVIQVLSDLFAEDRISMEELEVRLERAYKAQTMEDLRALVSDIEPAALATGDKSEMVASEKSARALEPTGSSKTFFAMMGGVVRRGVWSVPRRINALAIMGGVEIDLRDATLPPVTEIRAFALMGGVVVTVPPHVRVESDGFAIMGGFEDQLHQPASHDPSAPVVRLTGFALMGGVEAKVRYAGLAEHEDDDEDKPRRRKKRELTEE